eukprot:911616-Ditylum_brightwellii.AAC.1
MAPIKTEGDQVGASVSFIRIDVGGKFSKYAVVGLRLERSTFIVLSVRAAHFFTWGRTVDSVVSDAKEESILFVMISYLD